MTTRSDVPSPTEQQSHVDDVPSLDYRTPGSEDEFQAREHDAWFRDVADPGDVIERDRRMARAQRAATDAYEAGDRDAMSAHAETAERAFWTVPVLADERGYDGPAVDAATDDDADGWY